MPHQCVRCNTFFTDAAPEILKGCACGGKMFFFIRKERFDSLKKAQEQATQLSKEQKFQMEQDVYSMLGLQKTEPVVLDFESINMISPGKYELDLVRLFKNEPIIFKLSEGKYIIDLPSAMKKK